MLRLISLLATIFLISSCSGTGTSSYASIAPAMSGSEKGKVFIKRDSGYVGAGALVTIMVNGRNVGKLGNGEMLFADAKTGTNYVEAKIAGIQGLGLNSPSASFDSNGVVNNYYLVTLKTGLLSNKLMLLETTEDTWKTYSR